MKRIVEHGADKLIETGVSSDKGCAAIPFDHIALGEQDSCFTNQEPSWLKPQLDVCAVFLAKGFKDRPKIASQRVEVDDVFIVPYIDLDSSAEVDVLDVLELSNDIKDALRAGNEQFRAHDDGA